MKDIKLVLVATIIFLALRIAFEIFGELTLTVFAQYPFLKSLLNVVLLILIIYLAIRFLLKRFKMNME